MAWTNPRTWTDGELVTAAMMNPHIRDNLNMLRWQFARKTADQSVNNSTTLVDCTSMLLPVGTSEAWAFISWLKVIGPSAADVKIAFTVPASASIDWSYAGAAGTADTFQTTAITSSSGTALSVGTDPTTGLGLPILGTITTGGTAGNLQLQFAQDSAVATNTTVKANSWLIGLRIT